MPKPISMTKRSRRDTKQEFRHAAITPNVVKEYNLRFIGKKGSLRLWHEKLYYEDIVYAATGDEKRSEVVAQTQFSIKKVQGRTVHYVELSFADPKYSGFNLMPEIYRMLMKSQPGFMIQAGSLQSTGGQGIWNKLADFSDIQLFAVAQGSKDIIEVEKGEDGRLVDADGKVDLYRSSSVKIYAQAK